MNEADRKSLEARVLLLGPTGKEEDLTCATFARAGIACVVCLDPVQVCEQLTAGAGALLIAEEALHGGDRDLASWLGLQPLWSDLPVLVLARAGANSAAVAAALEKFGNVTVLERPTLGAALVSAVRIALRARQRQYQIRDQLVQRDVVAEQLRASEDRFRLAAEAVNGFIYEYDFVTGHVERQRGLYEVLGYHAAEVPSTAAWWREQVHPDDLEGIDHHFMALAGNSSVVEYRMRHRDGRWLHVEDRAVLQRGDDGRPATMVGCTVDVTAQKQANAERSRRETFTHGILGSITDGFGVVCKDWRFTFVNDELVRRIGKSRDEILGNGLWELFPDAVGNHAYVQLNRAMAERVTVEYEVHYQPWQRWMLEKVFPTADGGLAVYTRDITDRKRREALLAGQKRVLEMVASDAPLPDVLAAVCQMIEEQEPALVCSLLLSDEQGRHTGLAVGASLPAAYLRGLEGLPIGPLDVGSCGQALDSGEVVVAPDVATDERFAPKWRALLLGQGLRACRSVPVTSSDGTVLASLALYRREPGDPEPGNKQLVEIASHLTRVVLERDRAHRALRRSEKRLRRVFESNVTGMIHWDLEHGQILDANAEFLRMTGYAREDLANGSLNFRHLTPPEWTEKNEAGIQRLRTHGFAAAYEKEYFRKDGSRVPVIIAGTRFEDSPSQGMSILLDITGRKRAEEALRKSEARLSGILRRSPAGIVQTDSAGHMTLVNPRWCEMFGYTETELLGRNILDVTHPSSVAPATAAFGRLAAGGPDFQIEKVYSRKDGTVLSAQSNVAAIRSPAGEFLGTIAVVLDISERLQTEAELRRLAAELSEADRRKDVFLATLAHELRNPLAPIRNGLQLMKLAKNNGEALEKVRAMMDRQLSQLIRLVDDLLDVSRITHGKLELRKERVNLKAVIDAAVETSRPTLEQAGHELVVVVPDEPIFVDGDSTRLAQVVSNLLLNSARYTHRGGHVRLSVGTAGGTAVVSVKDNGIGIPPAMLDKVFVMFTQVDRELEKTTDGLGIGLSLVKGVLDMHGGTIEAKSDGEGMGSEFVVRLPVMTDVGAEPDRPNGQSSEGVPSALRRILVVDDNVDAADSLRLVLEMSGHDVRTANDGEAGIRVAAQFLPDVVLMDIGMPKLNGHEAARRIRQHPWGRSMVLVALTGWGQEHDRKKSADAGFDHHLVKPVELDAVTKLMSG